MTADRVNTLSSLAYEQGAALTILEGSQQRLVRTLSLGRQTMAGAVQSLLRDIHTESEDAFDWNRCMYQVSRLGFPSSAAEHLVGASSRSELSRLHLDDILVLLCPILSEALARRVGEDLVELRASLADFFHIDGGLHDIVTHVEGVRLVADLVAGLAS